MQEISCQAIVFDLDGVLVDSTVIVERHWRMWAAQHGLDSEFILAHAHGRRTIDTLRTVASHLNLDLEQGVYRRSACPFHKPLSPLRRCIWANPIQRAI